MRGAVVCGGLVCHCRAYDAHGRFIVCLGELPEAVDCFGFQRDADGFAIEHSTDRFYVHDAEQRGDLCDYLGVVVDYHRTGLVGERLSVMAGDLLNLCGDGFRYFLAVDFDFHFFSLCSGLFDGSIMHHLTPYVKCRRVARMILIRHSLTGFIH